MNLRERRAARQEAFDKFQELVQDGYTPKQAKAELDKWGKKKFGAVDWAAIIDLLLPILLKWLGL